MATRIPAGTPAVLTAISMASSVTYASCGTHSRKTNETRSAEEALKHPYKH